MGVKSKIKFQKCTVNLKGHGYEILIPPDTENLWVSGYNNKHWGSGWWGDVSGAKAIMYSAAVMGFNPTNKLIYFPLRKNERPECFKIEDAPLGEPNTVIDDCDLVFTTHQVPFKRSDWAKVKEMLRYIKAETYALDYEEERTCRYLEKSYRKWEKSSDKKKEYAIETLEGNILFYVFSRRMFQAAYLSLVRELKEGLEKRLCAGIYLREAYFPYREQLQMWHWPSFDFYKENLKEKG